MEHAISQFMHGLSWPLLAGVIGAAFFVLGKGADVLVKEAVTLSLRWGVPTAVIGATIVSIGTTTPEAAVSVFAAVRGNPGLALGNAVGSIICDTGLILGLAALISPLKLERKIVNRQGWIQCGAGALLVAACFPWASPAAAVSAGGHISRWIGFVFLGLLAAYCWLSIQWSKRAREKGGALEADEGASGAAAFGKLLAAVGLVVVASNVVIPAVQEAALRIGVPDAVIAATVVAFGTSLPELVTAVTAAWKGHGELAVGNVIGADILNVLFVTGAATAATPGGLQAPPEFFRIFFPAMLFVLAVFRVGVFFSGEKLGRKFGVVLLGTYLLVTIVSYR